ncbi:hypothetical protein [Duganella sp. HH105]|uniref:hypothetical protein n=1 Tax=Duganella sp. HH105 TaxID=1781067 RepID=UPI000877B663|nr:hypothetical protein [Duganella sp. HH105]OEZ59844.1 hypothetical protein DUGA6_34830 [Duganella sp. HH105]
MKALLIGMLWLAGTAAAADAPPPAAFTCESPEIPAVSTSNDAVRRVEKRIAEWKQCALDYQTGDRSEAAAALVQKAYDDIVARRNDWVAATNRYGSIQAAGRTRLSLGANGIAAVWDERNVHDMSRHVKRADDSDPAAATAAPSTTGQ